MTTPAPNDDLVRRLRASRYAVSVEAASALEAQSKEIEPLRAAMDDEREACVALASAYCWQRYEGREPLNLRTPAVFTSHEWQKIADHIRDGRARTALKGA